MEETPNGSSQKYKESNRMGAEKVCKWCEKRAIKVDLKTIDKKELNKILRTVSFTPRLKQKKDKH